MLCNVLLAYVLRSDTLPYYWFEQRTIIKTDYYHFPATLFATLGSFGLGTVLSWSAPALPQLSVQPDVRPSLVWPAGSSLRLDLEQQSWVASLLNFGAFTAGPISGTE